MKFRDSNDGIPPFWKPSRYKSAKRKVARLDSEFLYGFADMSGTAMAQAFQDYRKEGREESLAELEDSLMTLSAIVASLRSRGLRKE